MEKDQVKNTIKFLSKNRMVRKVSRGFKKTPAFGKILKNWKGNRREKRKKEEGDATDEE
jgi:hypothetical protein